MVEAMGIISAELFLNAFAERWKARVADEGKKIEILRCYSKNKDWTEYMFGENGLLAEVTSKLSTAVRRLELYREVYTLDAALVGGDDLFRNNLCYPSELHALIEHEQGENLEEELWKLTFWRSPLKILICYDWNDYEKKNTAKREHFIESKIYWLANSIAKVEAFHSEPDQTDYLFLIGSRKTRGGVPRWRWASLKCPVPTELI